MSTVKTFMFRKHHTIRTFHMEDILDEDGKVIGKKATHFTDEHFKDPMNPKAPSINAAKRKSRELQAANGGLGMGSLRVVDKLPEVLS